MKEASPRTIHLKDYTVPPFLIEHVDLDFDLKEQGTRVKSLIRFKRNPASAEQDAALRLDGEGLKHLWLAIDGKRLTEGDFVIDDEFLTIQEVPNVFEFSAEVEIAPENNTALEGLYRSSHMFCTQCEAEGFRKITWFMDRPDVMASFDVRVAADKAQYPVLLSNGNPGEVGDLEEGRHFAQWHDPIPKPCYLFALVAGDLRYIQDTHTTPSGAEIDLRIYVEPDNIDKCDHAMASLINAMRWDEEKYGREYDLEVYNIVAVNDFNMGAMENKGLNVFNSKYVLARSDTATDRDFQGIEGVIAHEYFHNWTGNRITCRDWFQLSLKEGLTVYRDQEFSADMGSRGVKRIEDVRMLRAHQFAEDSSPMAHPIRPASYIEINNFYTLTVYEKGAEVVRMQARLLGDDLYRKATDLYFERFDGQAVTTEDFVACMADASGRDLSQFKHWYDYAGTPQLAIQGDYNAEAESYSLTIKQSVPDTPEQTNKPAFHIPLSVGLLDGEGNDMPLQCDDMRSDSGSLMLEITEAEQQFIFTQVKEDPTPSLLRGFTAPVKVSFDYTDQQLMHLMAFDSDGFNRWDAAQTLLQNTLLGMVEQHQAGQAMLVSTALVEAMRNALLASDVEAALRAEVLTLPSISYLGDFMETVDIDGLHLARETLRKKIATDLREDLIMQYELLAEKGHYEITSEAMGRRSLKNCVLAYLMSLDHDDETLQYAVNQYGDHHNMTDVISSLSLLADSNYVNRQEVLDDFVDRWQTDPLVMDKWFSVQASAIRSTTLDEVRELMHHANFSIKNPNKVRSLIGAFANTNPVCFHAADGSGYRFLTEQVLALDPLNPQIAARLLRVMSRWQRYDEGRQKHMRKALSEIAAAEVSKDVYEIASKSLEG